MFIFREEIEKQKSHERYMKLQEQGKTDQAKKDLGEFFFSMLQFLSTPYLILMTLDHGYACILHMVKLLHDQAHST
jgi:hypothetical protein